MNTPSRRAGSLALALATVISASAIFASCDNGSGLFSSIQQETKATADSVFLKTAVRDLVYYNNRYYSQLVGIYSRPAPGTAASGWSLVTGLGSLGSNYGCRGLVATSTGLYAAIYARDGGTETPVGIYRLVGSTWTLLMPDSTHNIQALYSANDEVFATVMTLSGSTPSYDLYYFNGASLVATDIAGLSTRPAGVVSNGSIYWAAAGTSVYRDTAFNLTSTSIIALSKTATSIAGSGTNVYVGTADGYVLRVNDTALAGTPLLATSDTSYAVNALAIVPKGALPDHYLIAGNSYEGYYESKLDGAGVPDAFQIGSSRLVVASDSADYNTSLELLPVFALRYIGDDTSGTLFAAGSATMSASYPGLWSNAYSSSTWSGWTAE